MHINKTNDIRQKIIILNQNISSLSNEINTKKIIYKEHKSILENIDKKVLKLQQETDLLNKVALVFKKSTENMRNEFIEKIETIVTKLLQIVYNENHYFQIDFSETTKKSSIEYFIFDGNLKTKLEKPFVGQGGGKITLVSLGMFLAISEITGTKGTIFLDEVTKMIDTDALENVAEFLKEYSKTFNRQILIISHQDELLSGADKGYFIHKLDGESYIEEFEVSNYGR